MARDELNHVTRCVIIRLARSDVARFTSRDKETGMETPSHHAPRNVPGYWMNETSGQLRPVIEAYLTGQHMTARDFAIMRVYLRQWINDGDWKGPLIDVLRTQVDEIRDRHGIERWLDRALDAGIDPL
jgi:hypothetical protein